MPPATSTIPSFTVERRFALAMRLLLAALSAAVVAALPVYFLLTSMPGKPFAGLDPDSVLLYVSFLLGVYSSLLGGVPLFFILRQFQQGTWINYLTSGALIGIMAAIVFSSSGGAFQTAGPTYATFTGSGIAGALTFRAIAGATITGDAYDVD